MGIIKVMTWVIEVMNLLTKSPDPRAEKKKTSEGLEYVLGLYRDNGKENGSYYQRVIWGISFLSESTARLLQPLTFNDRTF